MGRPPAEAGAAWSLRVFACRLALSYIVMYLRFNMFLVPRAGGVSEMPPASGRAVKGGGSEGASKSIETDARRRFEDRAGDARRQHPDRPRVGRCRDPADIRRSMSNNNELHGRIK